VINVITKRGRDLQGLELAAGGGSDSTYHGRSSYGQRLENGFEFLVSSSYFDSDGKRRLYYEEFDDPETSFGIAHDADDEQHSSFFAEIRYRDLTLQAGYGAREKGIPTGSYETLFDTSRSRTWDNLGWVDLSYQRELPSGWLFRGRAYYDQYRYYGDYLFDYSEDDEPDLVINRDDTWGDRWGTEVNFSGEPFQGHRLTLGGEFTHNFRQDQRNNDAYPPWTYLYSREDSIDWALYAQDEFRILDNLVLFAGVRYDENGFFGGSTNPRVGLVYNPIPPVALKLLYGRAFRAPNTYELFYHDGGESQKAADSLDPETIETFELVGEYEINEHLRFTGSAYYSEIDDLIALTTDPADDLLVFQNLGKLESYGLELGLEGHWSHGFRGGLSWAFQRTENSETGRRVANSPRHVAKLNLIAPILREQLFAGLTLRYMGDRGTVHGTTTEDFFLTDLTLLGRRFAGGLELSAGVKNLFDVEYFDPSSEEHVQPRIEQNGRTFFLSARYQF
jgi:iron complex outermembrane receptor protein